MKGTGAVTEAASFQFKVQATLLALTHGVNVGQAGALAVLQVVLQLWAAGQAVEGCNNGVGDLQHCAVVGWCGVQDLVQQSPDDC